MAQLEHVNVTVADARKTAQWMMDLFGWHIRWEGSAMNGLGYTIHVGKDNQYIALYTPAETVDPSSSNYVTKGGLNHIAVTVDDIEGMETRIRAAGFEPGKHADYEPGQRFYFDDENGIEFEVVSYT